MKRFIFFIFVALITLSLPVCALAADSGTVSVDVELPAETSDGFDTESANEQTEDLAESSEESDVSSGSSTVFEAVYSFITKHSSEVFSALAFGSSAVLLLCYKKGILPLLKGGISALSGGVGALGEEAKKQGESSARAEQLLSEKLDGAQSALAAINDATSYIKDAAARETELQKTIHAMRLSLTSQIDMLYEIFMYSSLPQFEKERVGEKIADIKAQITASEAQV